MEVYSIIHDLDQIDINSQHKLIQQSFARNKYLLRRYTQKFKYSSPRQFRNKVRTVLKEIRTVTNRQKIQRHSSKDILDMFEHSKVKRSSQVVVPISFKNNDSGHETYQSMARLTVFRNVQNIQRSKIGQKTSIRLSKRSMGELQSCSQLQQCDDKLQIFMNNRYKTTLARLKILYNNSRQFYTCSTKPTYLINNSLAQYISKNFTKQ